MSKIRNMSKPRIDIGRLAAAFKALGSPHRLRLLVRLVSCCAPGTVCSGPEEEVRRCVGDLSGDLDLAPSTISHHLKELRQAGLVRMERRGKNVDCWVDGEALQNLSAFFGAACSGALVEAKET